MFSSKIRMTMRMYIVNLLKGKISPEYILYPQDSGSLLYPSVTFCTKYIWQSFPGVRKFSRGEQVFQGWASFPGVLRLREVFESEVFFSREEEFFQIIRAIGECVLCITHRGIVQSVHISKEYYS